MERCVWTERSLKRQEQTVWFSLWDKVWQIVSERNPTLRGWYGYFKYSLPSAMLDVDQWVRERIHHLLRRPRKREGMVKGRERVEYPIAWFAAQRLF